MTLQKTPLPQANIGFSGFGQRRRRWDDGVPWLEFADGKWLTLRFFGPPEGIVRMVATHWLATIKNKKRFPMLCPNFNAVTRDLQQHYRSDYRVVKAGSGAAALDALRQLKQRNTAVALFLVDYERNRLLALT